MTYPYRYMGIQFIYFNSCILLNEYIIIYMFFPIDGHFCSSFILLFCGLHFYSIRNNDKISLYLIYTVHVCDSFSNFSKVFKYFSVNCWILGLLELYLKLLNFSVACLYQFTLPLATYEDSVVLKSLPTLGIARLFNFSSI